MRDFNMEVQRAQEMDSKSLDAALSALPMMADRRVLVIRDVSALEERRAKGSRQISRRSHRPMYWCSSWKHREGRLIKICRRMQRLSNSTI